MYCGLSSKEDASVYELVISGERVKRNEPLLPDPY